MQWYHSFCQCAVELTPASIDKYWTAYLTTIALVSTSYVTVASLRKIPIWENPECRMQKKNVCRQAHRSKNQRFLLAHVCVTCICVCVSCVVRVIHIESKLPVYHVIIANAAGSSTNQTTILLCMKSVCAALSHPANVFGNFEQRATKDSRDISSQQHQQHQLTLYAMLSSNCFVVFSECVFFSFHL